MKATKLVPVINDDVLRKIGKILFEAIGKVVSLRLAS